MKRPEPETAQFQSSPVSFYPWRSVVYVDIFGQFDSFSKINHPDTSFFRIVMHEQQ
jgi:hypothetical protein